MIADRIERMFGDEATSLFKRYKVDTEGTVRFMSVAQKCRTTREAQGQSLQQIAKNLKVAQHRLRDIENARVDSIRGAVLEAYVAHL